MKPLVKRLERIRAMLEQAQSTEAPYWMQDDLACISLQVDKAIDAARRAPVVCPKCGSSNHVEEEPPTGEGGRLDVFAEDSGRFACSALGPETDHGCGHKWRAEQ